METATLVMRDVKAAELIGVKPSTLRKWRTLGQGPAYQKVGRCVRYRVEDLKAFLDKQTVSR
jgi:predicted site-specific integrase-resolvase